MTNWTVYCRKISFYLASAHGRSTQKHPWPEKGTNESMARTRTLQCGIEVSSQQTLSQNEFKRSFGYICNVFNCKGKNRLALARPLEIDSRDLDPFTSGHIGP